MAYAILIVEDDLTFATILKTWLGKKGFQVDTVSNNVRARKQLDARTYDLVLSDLRLPDQDGIFLLQWMREHNHLMPLIIMTSYADIQSAVQAIKQGASDYVSKPIQPDILLKKIEEALKAPQSGTTASSKPKAQTTLKNPNDYLEGKSEAARQLYSYVGWWHLPPWRYLSTEPVARARNMSLTASTN